MASLSFQAQFSAYIEVASLAVLVWDILHNAKNDYHLLLRPRLGFPTMFYFLSRLSTLCWAIITVIYSNTPSIDCMTFKTTSVVLLIVGMTSTKFLCYFRVCAVWRWNRFIVGFFTLSWLSVAAVLSVAAIISTKTLQVENYCTVIIVDGRLIPAPFIVAVINHTLIVMAITYGVCKNTLRGGLNFGHGIMLMLGKSLPTFSRALLHDSQISYIIVMVVSAIALIWVNNWRDDQTTSAFRVAPMAPYFVLVTIFTGRVHRNTKLGLYDKVSLQSNDLKSQPYDPNHWHDSMLPRDSHPAANPTPLTFANVDGYRSDYSTTTRTSRGSIASLDFGMV